MISTIKNFQSALAGLAGLGQEGGIGIRQELAVDPFPADHAINFRELWAPGSASLPTLGTHFTVLLFFKNVLHCPGWRKVGTRKGLGLLLQAGSQVPSSPCAP